MNRHRRAWRSQLRSDMTGKGDSRAALSGRPLLLAPASRKRCCICGVEHKPHEPHDQASLFYQLRFLQRHSRDATWADAIAHCDPATRARCKAELMRRGCWSQPAAGAPIVCELEY